MNHLHYVTIEKKYLEQLWNLANSAKHTASRLRMNALNVVQYVLQEDAASLIFKFSPDYWECNCKGTNALPFRYIHFKQFAEHGEVFCTRCGALQEESHDAKLTEVIDMLMRSGYKEGHYEVKA